MLQFKEELILVKMEFSFWKYVFIIINHDWKFCSLSSIIIGLTKCFSKLPITITNLVYFLRSQLAFTNMYFIIVDHDHEFNSFSMIMIEHIWKVAKFCDHNHNPRSFYPITIQRCPDGPQDHDCDHDSEKGLNLIMMITSLIT